MSKQSNRDGAQRDRKQMVINYVPGEECRVAIVENRKLEEFHAERLDGPSNHVGNIYVGKVMNVEPAIQAVFIDFGLEANGFLHISDVHPQYFPGAESDETERVGKKTPRRERPPIQDCFRRGDEVAVQVLKEGVGTKGPTVTSYLSIPGRFLVMMPQMDKVGVSRKVEDEETRRKMRDILDQLDLPEGFGFILRTAGMERTKAELKRDLAYLMRLWKDMEHRWRSGNKPRLLYSESDLLVRALRDLLTSDIDEIVVDNHASLNRAARFLKIVAPRTSTRLVHYTGKSPIFHVTGVEQQIQIIHAREVPLSSGGRLVIDEAEAVVAIDVNSGKSRDARDSETNALQTNLEAADEICRQLRLRDLGGVIVNDFIDMRSSKNRRDLETRMRENLKKDRARWTIAPVSEFGILEMTRQRMRASHESQHFVDCPTCRGRGLVQRPDSVAGDALREMAALVDHPDVHRVELVVHPRIAGELLSTSRRALGRIERSSGKHVDVRVSEAINVDRVTFYAYDERGADLDLDKLGSRKLRDDDLVTYEITSDAAELGEDDSSWADQPSESQAIEPEETYEEPGDAEPHPIELEPLTLAEIAERDRQRAQGGQRGRPQPHGQGHTQGGGRGPGGAPRPTDDQSGAPDDGGEGEGGRRRRRRRRRRGRGGRGIDGQYAQPGQPGQFNEPGQFGEPPQGDQPYADGQYADDHNAGGEYVEGAYTDQAYDSSGAPIESAASADSYNVEDDEALAADPGHAVGTGSHHHDTGYNTPAGENGEPGEGGRRRRRRRRRGRGGRGIDGQQGGASMGQGQYQGNAPGGQDPEQGEPYQEQYAEGEYAPIEGEAPFEQPLADDGSYEQVGEPASEPLPPAGEGEEQGGRRRRRRRGGRGRGRPDSDVGEPTAAAEPVIEPPAPRDPVRAPNKRKDPKAAANSLADMFRSSDPVESAPAKPEPIREDRPATPVRRERPAPKAPAPKPEPAPAPQEPAGPKIRTLYSSRRRLAPGQAKGMKREE
ncbi:MAG: Rne/Rng family ribonuclease [Phycisphaerales bacterium]|nr:Rne/Rng family ribonuclease [Phycisphaerales bacterium]